MAGGLPRASSASSASAPRKRARSPSVPSRSGRVVTRLRAALEEELQALTAQAKALRLSIDDECDYRTRVARPAPSLTSLLELKAALQQVLTHSDQLAAMPQAMQRSRAAPDAKSGARSALSMHRAQAEAAGADADALINCQQ